jgi:GDPmannose 4,6-dehydratase
MKNKNIALILGITGQDGSYLSKILLAKQFKVFGITRKLKKKSKNFEKLNIKRNDVKFYEMAKSSEEKITKIIKKTECTHIFYLSGISSVEKSNNNRQKTILVNTNGLIDVLESIRKINKKIKIYNASSSECYGEMGEKKVNESTKFNPNSPYALSKVINYHITKNYRDNLGLWISNGISFNHDSPLRPKNFVIKKIVDCVNKIKKSKKKYLVLGNLNISRDWGWAPEHVNYIYRIMMRKNPSDFVIGTGNKSQLIEIVKKIFKIKNLDIKKNLRINKKYFRPNEIMSNCANVKKLNTTFGSHPCTKVDTIIYNFLNTKYY